MKGLAALYNAINDQLVRCGTGKPDLATAVAPFFPFCPLMAEEKAVKVLENPLALKLMVFWVFFFSYLLCPLLYTDLPYASLRLALKNTLLWRQSRMFSDDCQSQRGSFLWPDCTHNKRLFRAQKGCDVDAAAGEAWVIDVYYQQNGLVALKIKTAPQA